MSVSKEQLEEMLVDIRQQEDACLATLNKLAGARDTINHLLSLCTECVEKTEE